MQLRHTIGDPAPANESELQFVSEFRRTRMTLAYQMMQGGQAVHRRGGCAPTRGETGPWGELVSATIGA